MTETTETKTETVVSPEAQAAQFLMSAIPASRILTERLTGTQAKRVLTALLESPLEQTVPGFTTTDAAKLFDLGVQIAACKHIMFNEALKLEEKGELSHQMSPNGEMSVENEIKGVENEKV